jgi:hypothetical protein
MRAVAEGVRAGRRDAWPPALYLTAHALRPWMPALRPARDLRAIADASLQFDELQQLIEKSDRERKYLR